MIRSSPARAPLKSVKKEKKIHPHCVWAEVHDEIPWSTWWPELAAELGWSKDAVIERWEAAELHWSRVLDSLNSFTLFKQNKVLVIQSAEKALKLIDKKELPSLLERLGKGPHQVILKSNQVKPEHLEIHSWKPQSTLPSEHDEKSGFRWIDLIHYEKIN